MNYEAAAQSDRFARRIKAFVASMPTIDTARQALRRQLVRHFQSERPEVEHGRLVQKPLEKGPEVG